MPSDSVIDPDPPRDRIEEGRSPHRRSLVRDLVEIVTLAVLIYLLIAFAVLPVHVEGTSMYPGLQNNNLLLAEKVTLIFGGPSRGDVVIIKPPIPSSQDFIKRVIGLPGEWVRIAPDSGHVGQVFISETRPTSTTGGVELKEPYINGVWADEVECCTAAGTFSPLLPTTGKWVQIPRHDYFVMGDNRNFSEDSRTFGWEPRSGILAIAIARFWPLNKLGLVPDAQPTLSVLLGAGTLLPVRRRRRRRARDRSSDRPRAPS
ncbi:MAG TPA: signal peptidase I [Candidatus Dormibacteraeota bacterium]|nr:signal peptidase I [Candidatus Dormibacteraeota bacterium]